MEYLDTLSLTENLIDKIFVLASLKLSSVIKKKKKNRWSLRGQISLISISLVILDKSPTTLSLFSPISVSGDYSMGFTGWHEN